MSELSADAVKALWRIDRKGFAGHEDLLHLVDADIPVYRLLAGSLAYQPRPLKSAPSSKRFRLPMCGRLFE